MTATWQNAFDGGPCKVTLSNGSTDLINQVMAKGDSVDVPNLQSGVSVSVDANGRVSMTAYSSVQTYLELRVLPQYDWNNYARISVPTVDWDDDCGEVYACFSDDATKLTQSGASGATPDPCTSAFTFTQGFGGFGMTREYSIGGGGGV